MQSSKLRPHRKKLDAANMNDHLSVGLFTTVPA